MSSVVAPVVLALDTSTLACSVALKVNDNIISELDVTSLKQQSELLLPMIDNILRQATITIDDVDIFVFGHGPGSFTGLRLAASVAQGLAFASNKPVIGISTLQMLAQQAYDLRSEELVLAALDARMNEVYWGLYKVDAAGYMQAIIPDCLQKPEQVVTPKEFNGKYITVGTSKLSKEVSYPRADELIKLYTLVNVDKLQPALPIYLRNKVTD